MKLATYKDEQECGVSARSMATDVELKCARANPYPGYRRALAR